MAKAAISNMAGAAAILLVLVTVPATMAETYLVGDSSGWIQGFDYTAWTRGKTFKVGDVLEFKYRSSHTVDVVNKDSYDNCDTSNLLEKFSGGDTKYTLNATGAIYFICATPGHCQAGMKLAVNVQPSAGPPTGSPSPPASPRSPSAPSAAARGVMGYAMMGASMALGYGAWIMG
ncbi:PREDICTED: uclacyanin-2 [Tarenaya hassleriana]|uniref:uclacyanin-2 n=1 Tax=Tarenaya hassleriana TaxID=28532 RepID=UPI00053C1EF3|nr:PREDICTED: uclacyanin-2 [Tarenaya hassleriana]